MPNTNGHGPKLAILYARVSTDEQARSGYSLAQQLEALREYAAREGYEVLEGVSDPGQSGAALSGPVWTVCVIWSLLGASLWCWHRIGTASPASPPITTCGGGSSTNTEPRSVPSTTGEMRARRASSQTASSTSSPSTSGPRSWRGAAVASLESIRELLHAP